MKRTILGVFIALDLYQISCDSVTASFSFDNSTSTYQEVLPDVHLISASWYTATIGWSSNLVFLKFIELHCSPLTSNLKFNTSVTLDSSLSNYTLKSLQPAAIYQLRLVFHFTDGMESLESNVLHFKTAAVPANIAQTLLLSQAVDIVLIGCLLTFWGAACCGFYRQWSSFHIQLPNRYTHYKSAPKGLEHVKVVGRTQDSIIYRGHNRSMSTKIVERNRKLARMHTSPAAMVELRNTALDIAVGKPDYKRRSTTLL
ncbi:hypothetical protein EB796_002971 [Bugula neritina]|uniref:Fibronectin type-III domain-containing protein n=1 Tax=Bugula neritina TaxID=10212 RepID=A0A7J7KKE0_BUGNE|nr:hypothetical protein EB796_002971 [Bugula neritina]